MQECQGLFTYSVVVVDNDEARSGETAVAEAGQKFGLRIDYVVEPRQGIANARNRAVGNAVGDYLAFIDDDEYPIETWLLRLFNTCNQYNVDGVLGPVRRYFESTPPAWLQKSRILDRRVNSTGTRVDWRESRTGNVMLRQRVIEGDTIPFRSELKSGEDKDFFWRKTAAGFSFIWSSDAEVFEVLPSSRWKRSYFIKRALMNGAMGTKMASFRYRDVIKAVVAVPFYAVLLPFSLLLGQHRFMTLMMKFSNHLGRLLAVVGFDVVRGPYLSGDED
jgi:glycosyltransferase involved in cell wall biosynthesis